MTDTIILASASPRRKELLNQIGIKHIVCAVNIDESPLLKETPTELVSRLAREKAIAAQGYLDFPNQTILAADTIIEYQGVAIGKPKNESDAIDTLLSMSNKSHNVSTGFCLLNDTKEYSEIVTSEITFGEISEHQARAYWLTGEPKDKAGSYAIQGLGAMFVSRIVGSYSAVVGLPLFECRQALIQFGVEV
ncbi:septum formation inhibitor Maf [Alteromonas sp. 5E99-2]|uniref:Maf family protein n=1 Tax=Alteromonas sp. 5E99-2 TaxID=2817683 RepID=UPI001A98B51E|nr:Maf family protein [Alteromonas sp. 5E99-2]MBO1255833.1 septum formation inhibitor Maf [Alteromonas sp. 5E99-2]